MNNPLERIAVLISDLSKASKTDRKKPIAIWEQFRREVQESSPSTTDVVSGISNMLESRDWKSGEAWLIAGSIRSNDLALLLCRWIDMEDPAAPRACHALSTEERIEHE